MPYLEKKQESGKVGIERKPVMRPLPKVEKKNTSILGGRKDIPMGEIIRQIKTGPGSIPGSGMKYTKGQRETVAKEALKGFGSYLQEGEPGKAIKTLEKKLYDPRTPWRVKGEIKRQISFLRTRFSGK